MLKRTLQAPPQESGAIDGYTSELSRLLRPALPGERADEIVTEAQAHLYDRADALAVEENVSHAEAESRAVAAFTPAIQFAREMAQAAFEDGRSKAWRAMGQGIAIIFFGSLFLLLFASGFSSPIIPLLIFYLPILVALCAYRARRSQARQFTCLGALAVGFTLLFANFYYLDGAPSLPGAPQQNPFSMTKSYNHWYSDAMLRENQSGFLQKIKRAFVADLSAADERNIRKRTGTEPFTQRSYVIYETPRPFHEKVLQIALSDHLSAKTAGWFASIMAGFGAWLVTLDWLFAKLGRAVFAKRRARRVKQA